MSPVLPNQNSIDYGSNKHSQAQTNPEVVPSTSLGEGAGTIVTVKSYRWNRPKYSRNRRRIDIWVFVCAFLFKNWRNSRKWSYSGGFTPEKQASRRRTQAIWIRENFLQLGPTFIKLGQLFSTRADLFPTEYVEELSKLQDRVPAFPYEQVKETIELDFGKPINQLFFEF